MKLVLIFGPMAVGKMTVGQELAKITDLRLFHNHMTIDLVSHFFSYGSLEGKRLVNLFRREIFEAVARSELPGLIFTFVWAFEMDRDHAYVNELIEPFRNQDAEIYFVELEAPLEVRLARNATENRLSQKPSKRNLEWSRQDVLNGEWEHRMNSLPGEIKEKNYIRIDNSSITAEVTAKMIKRSFNL